MVRRGEGRDVSMSDASFNKYPCCLSLKVLDEYYFNPLEKGLVTESVLFCHNMALS